MSVFIIPFWVPIVWALFTAYRQRTSWPAPLNSWWVVALVFALNYVFFKVFVIIFIVIEIIRSGVFSSNKKAKQDEN